MEENIFHRRLVTIHVTFSIRTAHALNSGVFVTVSPTLLVSQFAFPSRKWKAIQTSPAGTCSVTLALTLTEPRRELTYHTITAPAAAAATAIAASLVSEAAGGETARALVDQGYTNVWDVPGGMAACTSRRPSANRRLRARMSSCPG
mgnify:CR=1 FL=1